MTRWCVWPLCSLSYALCFRSWLFKCPSPAKFLWFSDFFMFASSQKCCFLVQTVAQSTFKSMCLHDFLYFVVLWLPWNSDFLNCNICVEMKSVICMIFLFSELSSFRESFQTKESMRMTENGRTIKWKAAKNVFSWRFLVFVIGRLILGSVCRPCFSASGSDCTSLHFIFLCLALFSFCWCLALVPSVVGSRLLSGLFGARSPLAEVCRDALFPPFP